MAHIALLSMAVVLFIGSVWSDDCNMDNINQCWQQARDHYCPYYQKITDCLKALEKNCEDDRMFSKLEGDIKGAEARATQCPGHKEGQCFSSELIECHRHIPFDVKYKPNLEVSELKAHCDAFSGYMQSTIDCLEKIQSQCTLDAAQQEVAGDLLAVEQIKTKCASL